MSQRSGGGCGLLSNEDDVCEEVSPALWAPLFCAEGSQQRRGGVIANRYPRAPNGGSVGYPLPNRRMTTKVCVYSMARGGRVDTPHAM